MAKKKRKSWPGLIRYESDEKVFALAEYAELHLCSFATALRHEAIRLAIHFNGGMVPDPNALVQMVEARGVRTTAERVARDLRSLGWKVRR